MFQKIIKKSKKIPGVIYYITKDHSDNRGKIWTSWYMDDFKKINFKLDKFTVSKKNVLRGFHGDSKTWKLVSCVKGKVLNVLVDYRDKKKKNLPFEEIYLSENDNIHILIPPMVLNSWLSLSKESLYHYKFAFKGTYNDINKQISLKWNSEKINYSWPISKPILSNRDK